MTSKQVMLTVAAVAMLLCGCTTTPDPPVYKYRQVWAVAPLRNESGSRYADGARFADKIAQELEGQGNIDVLPVNRVIAAMQSLDMREITSPTEALALLGSLGVDGLVVGTMTAYDPYDPPKLGLAIELYVDPSQRETATFDVRQLSQAATDEMSLPSPATIGGNQPVNVVSGFFDASDPGTRRMVETYGRKRGADDADKNAWRLYRISIDLYSEFVSHVVVSRLMQAERQRLAPPPPPGDNPA